MGREDEIVKERMKKLEELRKLKIDPYPYKFDKKNNAEELQKKYSKIKAEEKTKDTAQVAGRVMAVRDVGNIIFVVLQDSSGKVQLVLQKGETPDKKFEFLS